MVRWLALSQDLERAEQRIRAQCEAGEYDEAATVLIETYGREVIGFLMLMDLSSGETLGQRLDREKRLSLADAAAILLPVVSAVGSAHALGIVHRDHGSAPPAPAPSAQVAGRKGLAGDVPF
jgi:serine/threonine protein kinase